MPVQFEHVDLKAPRKVFLKDKKMGDIRHVARFSFDVVGVDDETLMALTAMSDGGRVKITIEF